VLKTDCLIRKMTVKDIERIMEIELESFPLLWSRESYMGELQNSFANYLVCDCEGEIAAFGGIWVVFEEAHITNVAVGSAYRQQGLGKNLMLALKNIAREKKAVRILLEVRPSNEAARKMYEGLGFRVTAIRERYYSDNGEDALVMVKLLI